jgi:hypothetical protein
MAILDCSKLEFKKPKNELKNGSFLGNNTGTEAALLPRGLQLIGIQENLIEKIDQETGEISTFCDTKTGKRVYRNFQESSAHRYIKPVSAGFFVSSVP